MSKSITPKHIVIITERDPYTGMNRSSSFAWKGRVTDARLAEWVQAYCDSLKPDGANYHISRSLGYMPMPHAARIVTNDALKEVKASWQMAAFQVL